MDSVVCVGAVLHSLQRDGVTLLLGSQSVGVVGSKTLVDANTRGVHIILR